MNVRTSTTGQIDPLASLEALQPLGRRGLPSLTSRQLYEIDSLPCTLCPWSQVCTRECRAFLSYVANGEYHDPVEG